MKVISYSIFIFSNMMSIDAVENKNENVSEIICSGGLVFLHIY